MAQVDLGCRRHRRQGLHDRLLRGLDVPPTLVSFAVAVGKAAACLPEFKGATTAWPYRPGHHGRLPPDAQQPLAALDAVEALIQRRAGHLHAGLRLRLPRACSKCASATSWAYRACRGCGRGEPLQPAYGSFIVELADDAELPRSPTALSSASGHHRRASSTPAATIDLAELQEAWESGSRGVFPTAGRRDPRGRELPRQGTD